MVKNPPAKTGDIMKCGFDPWVRKIPWRTEGQPMPVFLGRGALQAKVHGAAKSQTQLSSLNTHTA